MKKKIQSTEFIILEFFKEMCFLLKEVFKIFPNEKIPVNLLLSFQKNEYTPFSFINIFISTGDYIFTKLRKISIFHNNENGDVK